MNYPVLHRKQHRLRLHGRTVLKIISDSKEEEVKVGWRKMHNEKHNNLYSWPMLLEVIKKKKVQQTMNVASMVKREYACSVLVAKPARKRTLG